MARIVSENYSNQFLDKMQRFFCKKAVQYGYVKIDKGNKLVDLKAK